MQFICSGGAAVADSILHRVSHSSLRECTILQDVGLGLACTTSPFDLEGKPLAEVLFVALRSRA